eukprot:TRINITY_DN12157_c0_g1_i1.p1 TRINITY_DN12157_c0_g1~~TRINITY_DN12157_c0_g1_i1.p1  ORF type:complete len:537 (-),score=73.11 TRINITY_DN12157_c0_g1_i1:139-1749(-)
MVLSFRACVLSLALVYRTSSSAPQGMRCSGQAYSTVKAASSALMRLMDENCDDRLSADEISAALPRLLGKDAKLNTNQTCTTYKGPLIPVLLMNIEVLHSLGRVDYGPCSFHYQLSSELPNSSQDLSLHEVIDLQITFVCTYLWYEQYFFKRMYDGNNDGCLSQPEWDVYAEEYGVGNCSVCNMSAVMEFQLDTSSPELTLLANPSSSCVDSRRFGLANSVSFSNVFTRINETARCNDDVADDKTSGGDSSNGAEMGAIAALAAVLGIFGIATIVLCFRALRYQQTWRQRQQMEQMLKAKIDAWTYFKHDLSVKPTDLQPAFCHCLGLHTSGAETISLFDIVHTEDEERLRSALEQALVVKNEAGMSSMPVMTRVRLQYGVHAQAFRVVGKWYEEAQKSYVFMEVLMTRSSKSAVLVGLTSLSEVGPPSTTVGIDSSILSHQQCIEELASGSQSVCNHSVGDFVLNSTEEVLSDTESQARTFKSAEVNSHLGGQITAHFSEIKRDDFNRSVKTFVANLAESVGQRRESDYSDKSSL